MHGATNSRETVVVLAGGEATRLPRKLERLVDGVPLLVRVVRTFASTYAVIVSYTRPFPPALDAAVTCPRVLDRWPGRGPLGGMLSACQALDADRLYVVAADLPRIGPPLLAALCDAWHDGDEAVIPEHDGGIEPLAALYDRHALLREGLPVLLEGNAAVHGVVERLRARRLPMSSGLFANVNTPEDWSDTFAS